MMVTCNPEISNAKRCLGDAELTEPVSSVIVDNCTSSDQNRQCRFECNA